MLKNDRGSSIVTRESVGRAMLAFATLWGGPAAAQAWPTPAVADTVVPLEGVVVSTVRATTTTGGSSAVVVAPDSLHLAPAPTLEQVLRELPFVSVRENSRGQAEITVRGSDSRQVAVLVDGIPLTLGWDHRTDPSIVPVTGARSITLVRGLHSVLYGPNVLGGVVEIGITQGAAPGRSGRSRVRLGADEHGGVAGAGVLARTVEGSHGDWDLLVGAGLRRRAGVAVPGGAGDTLTRRQGLRANSDLTHLDAFASARYDAIDGRWAGVTASAYGAERGVPPELHVQRPRLWRYPGESRVLAILSGGSGHRRTPWGTGDVEASVGLDLGRTEIESFETADYEAVADTERGAGRTVTVRLLGDHTLGRGSTLTGAATYADVSHRERIDAGAAADYRQRLWSVASELSAIIGRSGRVSAGLAMDGADTPEAGGKPPLGTLHAWGGRLGVSALAGERARVHAAVSRRARFPSLRELYSGALGRFQPNPELEAETLVGAEAGATARAGALEIQGVLFHHRLSDAVVRTVTPEGRFRRENAHEIRSTGVELLGDVEAGRLRIGADFLVQHVELTGAGATAGRRPEHQPPLRAGATAELPLMLRLDAVAAVNYTAAQFCVHPDTGRDLRLEAGGMLDLGFQRTWPARGTPIRVSAFVDNLTDAAVFDQCGLPQPGRTFRIGLQVG